MKAFLRNIRIADKKMNLVAALVRRKPVDEALSMLKFMPKKAAKTLREVIQSAVSNATHNLKQKRENLFISQIMVNEGPTLKRSRPVSRGRSHPIHKKTCHVTVEVAVKAPEEKKVKTKEETSKKSSPKKE